MADSTYDINMNFSGGEEGAPEAERKENPAETAYKKIVTPVVVDAGNFIKQMFSVIAPLKFVLAALSKSKVISAMGDALISSLSALIDLFLVPLVPFMMPLIRGILNLLPTASEWGKGLANFLKDPAKALSGFAAQMSGKGGISGLFGDFLKSGIENFSKMSKDIKGIWSDDSKGLWDKIGETALAVWDFIKTMWGELWKEGGWASEVLKKFSDWLGNTVTNLIDKIMIRFGDDLMNIVKSIRDIAIKIIEVIAAAKIAIGASEILIGGFTANPLLVGMGVADIAQGATIGAVGGWATGYAGDKAISALQSRQNEAQNRQSPIIVQSPAVNQVINLWTPEGDLVQTHSRIQPGLSAKIGNQ